MGCVDLLIMMVCGVGCGNCFVVVCWCVFLFVFEYEIVFLNCCVGCVVFIEFCWYCVCCFVCCV